MNLLAPVTLITALTSIVCGAIDARCGLIPNRITYPSFAITLCLALAGGCGAAALLGASCAGGFLLALHVGTRGRGLGLGDVKLGACIGAGMGTTAAFVALGTAFVAGGIAAAFLLATGRASRGDTLRFGPYMAFGTVVAAAARWSVGS